MPCRRRLPAALLTLLLALLLVVPGCGDGGDDAPTEGTAAHERTDTAAGESGEGSLVVWADDVRAEVMEDVSPSFEEEHGVNVTVQQVPFEDIRARLQTAGPAGEGPDVVLGANDWVGELVASGAVATVDLTAAGDFEQVAVTGFTYDGQTYGVPYALENLALYRNTDLVPEAPETWEDLEHTALRLEANGEVEHGLLLPATAEEAPYFTYPLFSAFGSHVFAYDPETGYDQDDLQIDSENGLRFAETFRGWVEEGLLNGQVTGEVMQRQFGEGNAGFAISGPWSLVQGGRGWEEQEGLRFAVSAIPPIRGGRPRPFVGVQGFMVSSFASDPVLARTFVTDFAASEEVQLALYEANRRPPALSSVHERVRRRGDLLAAFAEAGADGVPLPAFPFMSSVFRAWGDAYTRLYRGDMPARQAFERAAERIRGSVEAD